MAKNLKVAFPKADQYNKAHTFPEPRDEYFKDGSPRDPKRKAVDPQYFLEKARFLYSAFCSDSLPWGMTLANDYFINRQYAAGTQDNTKYMDMLCPRNKKDGKRKGFMNISWDNLSIYPKFRDIAKNRLLKFDYRVDTDCIDEDSTMERRRRKFTAYVKQVNKEFLDGIAEVAGMDESMNPMEQQKLPIMPRSLQELDMLDRMGSFKLDVEIGLQKYIVNDSLPLSQWQEVETKMKEDGVDLGMMACQCYFDPVSGAPMVRYVDPQYLIIRHTRDQSFQYISDAAEIRFFTISQLREYGLSNEQLALAASAYSNTYGNLSYTYQGQYKGGAGGVLEDKLSACIIPVLDMDFESFCTDKYEINSKNGIDRIYNLPATAKKASSSSNTYGERKYQRRYKAMWIIGTEIVFDYGLQQDVPYDEFNRPLCSYKAYRCSERSITSRCIATIDDMQLAVLKFRNAWALAKPPGVRVEWGSLSNMTYGGSEMDPKDILRLYTETGNLIYRAQTVGGVVVAGQAAPIEELKGGIGQLLDDFIKSYGLYSETLRELTAIGQVVDGTVPAGDKLVGIAKMAEASTTDAHRNILMGYRTIKQNVCSDLAIRWQNFTILNDGSKRIIPYMGGTSYEVIKISADDAKRKIRVICRAEIDDGLRDKIMAAAETSLAATKQGSSGITFSDYFYILDLLSRGEYDNAWLYLSYREDLAKQEQAALQQQNMQLNGQNMQAQEKMKADANMQSEAAKMKTAEVQGMLEIQKILEKGNQDRLTKLYESFLNKGVTAPPDQVIPSGTPAGTIPPGAAPQNEAAPMMADPSQTSAVPEPALV